VLPLILYPAGNPKRNIVFKRNKFIMFVIDGLTLSFVQFIESMSEVIRKGIEEASHELEKENQEKLEHEV
jgi:hypothetical protein